MLAIAFLSPGAACVVVLIGTTTAWVIERYRWRVLFVNLGITATPVLLAGVAFRAAVDVHDVNAVFLVVLGALGAVAFCVNIFLLATLMATIDGYAIAPALRATRAFAPAVVLNVGFLVATAGIYGTYGFGASAVIVLAVAAFGYMLRLVGVARERTKQYANLSWGVLSGLVRTLDERDSRAARHCAAVARFSRDMAAAVGMSKRDQELAHTAGLLHDIGKFTLSDRVMERGGRLTDADWRGIRRHPEIGAMLLKDLGVYGNVAEIVRAHHERIDGRGYPHRLTGDQIPELAKIVAVAEVYDTLTAPDTYRTPMNSFEALNELRRVAGSQLDERYVEVLADLLSGRGTDYRHADEADFDAELDIERRMNEAAAP
ncbi:MAG TPA: HD domain-containing phosphohydrolase [Solirubrobacteraceae bacterium]|nr:HD domain-containing phosphohydrolase [Solirubrobacteraceae bacterium]